MIDLQPSYSGSLSGEDGEHCYKVQNDESLCLGHFECHFALVPYSLITPLKVTVITQANLIEGHCSFFHCSQLRTDFSPEMWETKPALSLTVLTRTFWSTEARMDR